MASTEDKNFQGHDIILVGASAGGVEALTGLVADLPAAVFVVLHISAQWPSLLPQILARNAQLIVKQQLGTVSTLTRPECHGALWEIKDPSVLRFRCHVGHRAAHE
jgi:hypothetical protein